LKTCYVLTEKAPLVLSTGANEQVKKPSTVLWQGGTGYSLYRRLFPDWFQTPSFPTGFLKRQQVILQNE
jgi:hypothetical protein